MGGLLQAEMSPSSPGQWMSLRIRWTYDCEMNVEGAWACGRTMQGEGGKAVEEVRAKFCKALNIRQSRGNIFLRKSKKSTECLSNHLLKKTKR